MTSNWTPTLDNSQAKRVLALALQEKKKRSQSTQEEISFVDFFERTSTYKAEQWQRRLCDRLEKLRFQKGQRIKIHKPPQRGGSIVVSQRLPVYLLGYNPNIRIRLVTFNETHSERFSRSMLNIMRSDTFHALFPRVEVDARSSVGQWSTSIRQKQGDAHQHSFIALGLASGIVGTGGDIWIIDDPYKNREEAFSTAINDKIKWNWKENIQPRLAPEDNIIVMYHRWHNKDFAGLLDEEGDWEDIRIPDICDSEDDFAGREIGEALSPRYPIEYLLRLRDGYTDKDGRFIPGLGNTIFENLHQGNARPRDGGGLIKKNWWDGKILEAAPKGGKSAIGCDIGAGKSKTSNKSSFALGSDVKIEGKPAFVIVDMKYGQWSPHERNAEMRHFCDKHKEYTPKGYFEKGFGIGTDMTISITDAMRGISMWPVSPKGTKLSRADAFAAQVQAGNVYLVKGDWNNAFIEQCSTFTGEEGGDDDLVDSVTLCFNMLITR